MRRTALWLAVASATVAACSGDGRSPLVVYSPHGRDLLTLYEGDFERLHPGIDLRYLDMGSQEVFDRVRSEQANPQADVWFGGPDVIFARGAEAELLEPFEPFDYDRVVIVKRAAKQAPVTPPLKGARPEGPRGMFLGGPGPRTRTPPA